MTDTKKKIQSNGSGVNPVMAAAAGVVVGAGLAVAGIVMSDKKNQAKVKEVANKIKDQVNDKKDDIKEKVIKEVKNI